MSNSESRSIFILKLIGSLFSVVALLLAGLMIWLFFVSKEIQIGSEYNNILFATGILLATTTTISVFIWWIVSNRKKFLNYD